MMIHKFVALAVVSLLCTSVLAEGNAPSLRRIETQKQQKHSIKSVTPIFGQLVTFSFPNGFMTVFENTKDGQYIQESVLQGENADKWSQMITVTGMKGLAANQNITPMGFAGAITDGFKRACPDSYMAADMGKIKFGPHDGFAVVASCGVANPAGEAYSESALLIVIQGEHDYYTIQWAERGGASKTPIKFDDAKWAGRLKKLAPIKLCPIVPGEKEPYPSCAAA